MPARLSNLALRLQGDNEGEHSPTYIVFIGKGDSMKTTKVASVFLIGLMLALQFSVVNAHQPVCEFADLSAEAPWQVPDATISYAYFGNVYPAGDVDYFSFQASAGQSILLSLSIPAIPDHDTYAPLMALMGPGIASDISDVLPADIVIPPGHGTMLIPLGDEAAYWFEPFGRKYFWNWDDFFFSAPQTAAYTVALWHPQAMIGRYSFVIGQREVFGGAADCFASYGDYWQPLVAGVNPYRDTVIVDGAMPGMRHDHSAILELTAASAPSVNLQLIPLAGGGYNVRVQALNFIFTPQNVDGAPVPNEGHAHLYIDGVKIARVYGEWFHLASLPQGARTLTVTLYANDHSAFAVDGAQISSSVSLADVALQESA